MGLVAKRTRLDPQVRRDLILDQAARLAMNEGLTAVTLDRVAREADVSKGLVYTYFTSRNVLLAALLDREQDDLRQRGMASVLRTETFAEMITATTRLSLEQARDRGALIGPLQADPSITRLLEDTDRDERDRMVRFFVRAVRQEYGLPLETSISAVNMLLAVTGAAGRLVAQGQQSVDEAAQTSLCLIFGGLTALAQHHRQTPVIG